MIRLRRIFAVSARSPGGHSALLPSYSSTSTICKTFGPLLLHKGKSGIFKGSRHVRRRYSRWLCLFVFAFFFSFSSFFSSFSGFLGVFGFFVFGRIFVLGRGQEFYLSPGRIFVLGGGQEFYLSPQLISVISLLLDPSTIDLLDSVTLCFLLFHELQPLLRNLRLGLGQLHEVLQGTRRRRGFLGISTI